MIAIFLELRPLIEVAAVFDGQRMEIESLTQELQLRRRGGEKVRPSQDTRRRTLDEIASLRRRDAPLVKLENAEGHVAFAFDVTKPKLTRWRRKAAASMEYSNPGRDETCGRSCSF
jgi:hypothetical protein